MSFLLINTRLKLNFTGSWKLMPLNTDVFKVQTISKKVAFFFNSNF